MHMTRCDLCGTTAKCLQKEIEGKEFDICERCWQPFAEKFTSKGRFIETLEEMAEYEELVY
jgi:ribosome-binding protein aMBF1 (putative translation factor)